MYRLTRLCLAHPGPTLLAIGLLTALFAAGLPRVYEEYGYRVLTGDDHPSIVALDSLLESFGGGLPVQIAWECGSGHPCADVFDDASLEMAEAISHRLAASEGIRNVQGPSNAPLLVPAAHGFSIRRLVERGTRAPDAADLARRALRDPLWLNKFVSADSNVGVIVVEPTDSRSHTNRRIVAAIEETLAPFEDLGFTFYFAGDPIEAVIGGRDLSRSSDRLVPLMVVAVLLVLILFSRSLAHALMALATMGVGYVWTFGLLGWLGWPKDAILEVLAPMILIMGVCDSVHYLALQAAEATRLRADPDDPVQRNTVALLAAREVGPPCLITTLTTAGAFLSFTTSDLDTFVRFGLITAFGVVVCLLLTFSVLPVLSLRLPLPSPTVSQAWRVALRGIVRTANTRQEPIILGSCALFLFCLTGWIAHLRVDTDWLESWGDGSRLTQSIRFLEDHLNQSRTLEVQLTLPSDTALEDPRTMTRLQGLADNLESVEGLRTTTSILDVVGRVNRFLHEDRVAFDRPSDSISGNAELLELVTLGDPSLLASWVSFDRSKIRLSVDAEEASHAKAAELVERVEAIVASHLPPDWDALLSGEVALTVDWVRDVQSTQLRSFPVAFLIVFALVGVFFRSVPLACAALVPTLLPVVVTLGAMGWTGLSLDVGRSMIAAVVIGIGVDDSIHLLDAYRRRRAAGSTIAASLRAALVQTGRAIISTSLALALGFLTLLGSAWQTISSFGFFVALAILGALGATLFVLPALMFAVARWRAR